MAAGEAMCRRVGSPWGAPAPCQNVNEAIWVPAAPVYLKLNARAQRSQANTTRNREEAFQLRPARLPVRRGGRVHSLQQRSASCN